LTVNDDGAPLLNIFGGKITTYRKLAEQVMAKMVPFVGGSDDWTAGVALPGGDFAVGDVGRLIDGLKSDYPFLSDFWAARLIRAYGTDARNMLGDATQPGDLGEDFGATMTAREIDWLMTHEYARTAEDIVWRRSKLGLRLSNAQIAAIEAYMQATISAA